MMEFIKNSAFFGAMISLIAYEIGLILKKKFKMAIFNPLLISIICVIGVLLIFHIDYDDYNEGGKYISYLLTPATVCLAVPLYEQIHLLKKNLKAVAAGIFSGTLAGLCSILLMAKLFGFDHQEYVTMLPKSITTAIGMGVSEELGGIVTITVAVIIITGVREICSQRLSTRSQRSRSRSQEVLDLEHLPMLSEQPKPWSLAR